MCAATYTFQGVPGLQPLSTCYIRNVHLECGLSSSKHAISHLFCRRLLTLKLPNCSRWHVHAKHIVCIGAVSRGTAALASSGMRRRHAKVNTSSCAARHDESDCTSLSADVLAPLQVHLLCLSAWPDGGLHRLPLPGGVRGAHTGSHG
jgi:hypothetical protein